MNQPKSNSWNIFLTFVTTLGLLLFPISVATSAVASAAKPPSWLPAALISPGPSDSASPSPLPSSSISPSASPSPSISASPSPSPTATPFSSASWSIDRADSLAVIVNKIRPLNPIKYQPVLDASINLAKPAASAYRKLKAAVSKAGLGTLCLNSGYRSYATQKATHAYQVARGKKYGYDGETVAARPGYSEHQTGLAADVSITAVGCSINNFAKTKASTWIAANAYKYGFVIRYPKNQQEVTGYIYEPWHLRYVGLAVAAEVNRTKAKTLELFWSLPNAPAYLK